MLVRKQEAEDRSRDRPLVGSVVGHGLEEEDVEEGLHEAGQQRRLSRQVALQDQHRGGLLGGVLEVERRQVVDGRRALRRQRGVQALRCARVFRGWVLTVAGDEHVSIT